MTLFSPWSSSVAVLVFACCSVIGFQPTVPSIDGQWQAVGGMRSGRELGPDYLATITVTVANGIMTITEPGIAEKATVVRLAPGNPGQIDLEVTVGGKKVMLEGIYQIQDNQWTLCVSKSQERGVSRPKSFEATGEGISLLKLKRAS